MYKTKKYQVRSLEDIFSDIDTFCARYPLSRRVFLADGDALSIETNYLLQILHYLKKSFPKLGRISTYASAQNLLEKTEWICRTEVWGFKPLNETNIVPRGLFVNTNNYEQTAIVIFYFFHNLF